MGRALACVLLVASGSAAHASAQSLMRTSAVVLRVERLDPSIDYIPRASAPPPEAPRDSALAHVAQGLGLVLLIVGAQRTVRRARMAAP